jgi:hypothetical protein
MSRYPRCATLFCAVLLFTILPSALAAPDDTAKQAGKAAGILIQKKDDYIMVKPDGADEPVKYLVGDAAKAMKNIYDASRVQLTYKKDGDTRQLVSIKKHIIKKDGTVTGKVVKVHNEFWVEVKPKGGLADAYAPGGNYKDKEFMDRLKGLKPGDSVTIKYTTDSERHRILILRKN